MDKTKITLIEDDKILSRVINEELSEAGFDVSLAFDGEEGLEVVRSKKPDLILLDLVMPKKNGFEVLEELKASKETVNIPIIILTMLGQEEEVEKGLKLGANQYVIKSQYAVIEIIDKIKDFLLHNSKTASSQLNIQE